MSISGAQTDNNLKRPDSTTSSFKEFKTKFKFVKKPTKVLVRDSTASMVTGDPTGTLMYGSRTSLPIDDTIILNDNNTLIRVWTHDDDLS